MHNKKGENNNSGNHIPWRSRGIFFDDYETSKYEYKQQSTFSEVKLSLNRVSFVFFIFLVVAFVFGSKIIYLASIKKENYFTNKLAPSVFLKRQDILDRNNNLLAKNVKLYNFTFFASKLLFLSRISCLFKKTEGANLFVK